MNLVKGKMIPLLLILVFVLTLPIVGCDNGAGTEKETPLIGYCGESLSYYFYVVLQEATKRAVEEKGWEFEETVANSDSATQFNQVVNFISKKPKAIIAGPIDSDGIVAAIDQVVEAGIPFAVVDNPATGGDVAVTVAFDNYSSGYLAGQDVVDRLIEKYGEPKGIVLNAYGAMSSEAWRLRKQGFDDVMEEYPNITYLAMPGEGEIDNTRNVFENALTQHGFIDAVHCPSDTPARGLYEALKAHNMLNKVGEEGHVIFVTIDGEPIALKMIREGYYDSTVVQDAVSYGEIALELMEQYTFKGEKVPLGKYTNSEYYWEECDIIDSPAGPYVKVPPYIVDTNNVDDPRHWGNVSVDKFGLDDF